MPPQTADQIRSPEQIDIPERGMLSAVFEALSPDGAKNFTNEILEALAQAKERGDFRPVQDVVVAWYRTLFFVRQEGFDEALEEAEAMVKAGLREGQSFEELRAELSLPEPENG